MPAPFRLRWSDSSLADLETLVARAPRQAERVLAAMEQLADAGLNIGREVRPGIHYWSVSPQGVYYRLTGEGGYLTVVRVVDVRRRLAREP